MSATAGRAARAHGEALEQALDAYHATLAAQGLAWVRRVGTPVTILGRTRLDARGRTCFAAAFCGRQGADFVGQTRDGHHVCIEAKSHAGPDAWDSGIAPGGYPVGGTGIALEQWDELLRAAGEPLGGLRGLVPWGGVGLVILAAWGGVWAIGPHALRDHVRCADRRTVRPGEVDTIGRRLVGVAWWDR